MQYEITEIIISTRSAYKCILKTNLKFKFKYRRWFTTNNK